MLYFVTENLIKSTGVIDDNVDVTKFSPLVQFSSKAFVLPMLGTHFFNDLLTKYNSQTLSSDETALVEKMQPCIIWRVTAQAGITMSYALTNKGYLRQSDDNATAADKGEVSMMYDHYISEAKLYEKELFDYIILNKSLFPEFLSADNKDSSIKNNPNNWKGRNFNEGTGFFFI